jgi:hypothetical protein
VFSVGLLSLSEQCHEGRVGLLLLLEALGVLGDQLLGISQRLDELGQLHRCAGEEGACLILSDETGGDGAACAGAREEATCLEALVVAGLETPGAVHGVCSICIS